MQEIMEFLRGRRSYRRFEQRAVEQAAVDDMLEAARIASCGANRQTLKYAVVQSPAAVAEMNKLVHWAAYLPPEQGTPTLAEQPTLFVVVLQDDSIPGASDTDAGLALGSLTAAAWAHGAGCCIMGALNRPGIKALLGLGDNLLVHTVVACGYPAHKSRIVEMENGSVKYYLDANRDYCVPKRPLEEILVKTV